jgi:hypothetical protein
MNMEEDSKRNELLNDFNGDLGNTSLFTNQQPNWMYNSRSSQNNNNNNMQNERPTPSTTRRPTVIPNLPNSRPTIPQSNYQGAPQQPRSPNSNTNNNNAYNNNNITDQNGNTIPSDQTDQWMNWARDLQQLQDLITKQTNDWNNGIRTIDKNLIERLDQFKYRRFNQSSTQPQYHAPSQQQPPQSERSQRTGTYNNPPTIDELLFSLTRDNDASTRPHNNLPTNPTAPIQLPIPPTVTPGLNAPPPQAPTINTNTQQQATLQPVFRPIFGNNIPAPPEDDINAGSLIFTSTLPAEELLTS